MVKLKNKKTGEIIDIFDAEVFIFYNQCTKVLHFTCLEDLNDWEDYHDER